MAMEHWIPVFGYTLSASVVIGGWLYSKRKEISHEKFKARLSRREKLLESYLTIVNMIRKTQGAVDDVNFTEEWLPLSALIKLYGTKEEYDALLAFADAFMGDNKNINLANERLIRLETIMIRSVRKDLGFELLPES